MNRKDFGLLVASLRQDMDWTQARLSEASKIDISIVSQIERGVKKHFEPDLLFRIANAFQLTTIERREFILASSGLETGELVRPNLPHSHSNTSNPKQELNKIKSLGDRLEVPSFVLDQYHDFIMANEPFIALFGVDEYGLSQLSGNPLGFNAVFLTYGKNMIPRFQVSENWEKFALMSMRGFRQASLRYRSTPYFQYLMEVFSDPDEFPLFDRYWKLAARVEEDKESNIDNFEYTDIKYGHLKFMAESTPFFTAYGELFFVRYLPMSELTGKVFRELAKKHGWELKPFASWPEKKIPK